MTPSPRKGIGHRDVPAIAGHTQPREAERSLVGESSRLCQQRQLTDCQTHEPCAVRSATRSTATASSWAHCARTSAIKRPWWAQPRGLLERRGKQGVSMGPGNQGTWAAMAACLVMGAAGCTEADGQTRAAAQREPITWTACPGNFTQECAWVPLPLDPEHSDGQRLPIFVSRYRAKDGPADAQLWLLNGGPGDSGSAFKNLIERQLAALLPRVDFYVLEHRGVGESARLGCA